MNSAGVLADAFGRVQQSVHTVLRGLGEAELAARVSAGANTIGWLVWHLARVQDDHVAEAAGSAQVYVSESWHDRLGLPFGPGATGFGFSDEQVAAIRVGSAELLAGYLDAVTARTIAFLSGLEDEELERVVDESYDPPVTLGVRLVSVIADDLEHAGQAAFVRGLLERGWNPLA